MSGAHPAARRWPLARTSCPCRSSHTAAGPLCITRCAACTAEGRLPTLDGDAARRLVIEHRSPTGEVIR
ncbi:MAG: hypothetical protein WKF73_18210 [Nocardioidaceae bacterium]